MIDVVSEIAAELMQTPSTAKSMRRRPTKSDQLQKLVARSKGATVDQIGAQLSWQPHTIRAAISRLRTAGKDIRLDRSGKTARYRAIQEPSQ